MRKRALAETQFGRDEENPLADQHKAAGEKLRLCLLDKFCLGKLPGSDVAELCYLISKAGGTGVEDLGLKPEQASAHGHAHIRLHAGKVYPEPDLVQIQVPLYEKREARRVSEQVPLILPSTLLRNFVKHPEVFQKDAEAYARLFERLPCYQEHPVVRRARSLGSTNLVRPIALYWDGVRYSVHDSFTGFYLTDLLSGQKFLSFLLRPPEVEMVNSFDTPHSSSLSLSLSLSLPAH